VAQSFETRVGWPIDEGSEYTPGVLYRLTPSGPAYATEAETVAAIIAESAKAPGDAGGRPLPLASTWCRGSAAYEKLSEQLGWIADGYPVIPALFANSDAAVVDLLNQADELSSMVSAGLPVSLIADSLRFFGDFYTNATYKAKSEADTGQCLVQRNITGAVANGTTSITVTTDGSPLVTGGTYGETVRFEGLPGGWAALNGNVYAVAVGSVTATTFDVSVNGSGFGTYTSGGYYVGRRSTYSPWGSAATWQQLGADYATSDQWAYLQEQYPDPPRVIAVANNEPDIPNIELSYYDPRYRTLYSDYATRGEKQQYTDLSTRLRDQANEFFGAWTDNLTEAAWQANVRWAGYGGTTSNNFITPRFHDCYQWYAYQVGGIMSDSFNDLSWTWHAWNGCCAEIYEGSLSVHYAMRSQANVAMSMRMARDMAEDVNQDYWFEVTTWDGGVWPNADGYADGIGASKRADLITAGINYTPGYYQGWTQYVLWIAQPRALRNFQYYDPTQTAVPAESLAYWEAIMQGVSNVHSNATLRRFWKGGTIVENPAVIEAINGYDRTNPYLARDYTGSLELYTAWDGAWPRNYHLATDLDEAWDTPLGQCPIVDPNNNTKIRPCWTLAYRIGTAPNREYLIYAHSTDILDATLSDVVVTIPGFQDVTLPTVPVDGAFYYIKEDA
jgi:hypothetical protein